MAFLLTVLMSCIYNGLIAISYIAYKQLCKQMMQRMNSSLKSLLKPDPILVHSVFYQPSHSNVAVNSTVCHNIMHVHAIHMYTHADCVSVFRESLGAIIGGILDYSVGFQSLAAVRFIMQCIK